jgi:hypothetical protein
MMAMLEQRSEILINVLPSSRFVCPELSLFASWVLPGRNVVGMVKAVVQVVGHSQIPKVPKNHDELRNWYHRVRFGPFFPTLLLTQSR